MHLRAILFASLLVLGSFTTACVGGEQVDEDDEPQAPSQAVDVSVQSGTRSTKDTKTTSSTSEQTRSQ